MDLCLFLTATSDHERADVDVAQLETLLDSVGGVVRRAIHIPTSLAWADPFLKADQAPNCVIQLYFSSLTGLESALGRSGPLVSLFDVTGLPECRWTQQAMLARSFTVNTTAPARAGRLERVTYLVAYEGQAEDNDAWLTRYIRQHPPLMVKLPGIREVEVYTRIDYCSDLSINRVRTLQRNKVVFDSAAALGDALASPLREELRKDFLSLPAFSGASPHYPMLSYELILP